MPKATVNGPSNAAAETERRMSLAEYLDPEAVVTEEVAYEPGTEPDPQATQPTPARRARAKRS
jgi:hypothetical protein